MTSEWPPLETLQSLLLGFTVLVAGSIPLAVPVFVLVLFSVTILLDRSTPGRIPQNLRVLRRHPIFLPGLLAALFALVSTAWAKHPGYALSTLIQVTSILAAAIYVTWSIPRHIAELGEARRTRYLRATALGFAPVAVYLAIDYMTGDGITLLVANGLPSVVEGSYESFKYKTRDLRFGVRDVFFNRNAMALVLLVPAAVVSLSLWQRTRSLSWPKAAVVAVAALACWRSDSSTATLALVAGIATYAAASISLNFVRRTILTGFLVVVLLAPALFMVPKALGLDHHAALPASFRQRVDIWDNVARLVLEHPVRGIGINQIKFGAPSSADEGSTEAPYLVWHPHNGILQIWLDLGGIGAIFAAVVGGVLIRRLGTLDSRIQQAGLSLGAITIAGVLTGWGLWQPWLVAAIAFGWLSLLVLRPGALSR